MEYNSKTQNTGNSSPARRSVGPVLSPERSVAFQIRRAHLAFDRLLTVRLNRHDVKSGFYNYLRALWIKDGITQRDLSEATRVTETTTVALLKGMAAEGLIERVRDPQDQRKIVVSLTEAGRALEPKLLPYAAELNEIATQGLSKEEVEVAIRAIKKIAANLEMAFGSDD